MEQACFSYKIQRLAPPIRIGSSRSLANSGWSGANSERRMQKTEPTQTNTDPIALSTLLMSDS